MRISDRMIYERARVDGGAARSRLEEATARVSTGLRVTQPGDDPAAAGQIVGEGFHKERLDAIATAAGRAADEVSAADSALGDVNTALTRALEIATQLGSDQYSTAERTAGATEVKGLLSTILSSLNARVGNRYVFGGTADDAPPFSGLVLDGSGNVDAAATGAYQGDTGVRQLEIAPGVVQDTSVRADVALRGAAGGVDVIDTLAELANALSADDATAVAATLGRLDTATSQVSTARATTGAIMNTLDAAVTANQAARDGATKRISSLGDADTIEAATDLAHAQNALEAALTATAKSFKFSLLDKL